MTRLRALAVLVSLAAVGAVAARVPAAVRSFAVLLYWCWVPGAVLLSCLERRWRVAPDVPAALVSLSLLVAGSQIAVLLHHPLGASAMLVIAAVTLLLLLTPRPLGRTEASPGVSEQVLARAAEPAPVHITTTLDVIIPARNCARLLEACLQEVRSQLLPGDRVIVVDDGSTDDTVSVAEWAGARVLRQDVPNGPYSARQRAALASRAWGLVFLDARCRPLPGWLESHRRLLATPGTALSCSNVLAVANGSLASRIAAYQQPFRLEATIDGWHLPYYPACNLGVLRDAFWAVEGFPTVRSGGDAYLCWRIQEAGLGALAVDRQTRVRWVPRATLVGLAGQWWRYGRSSVTMAEETGGVLDYLPGHPGTRRSCQRLLGDVLARRVAPAVALGTLAMAGIQRLGNATGRASGINAQSGSLARPG